MKKNYLIKLLLLLLNFSVMAQLPVSHTAENKNAVLEEFTGMHCVYCPDGHKIANQIYTAHPNDVVLINVHTGGYATPGAGEPDFRTPFGSALASQSGLTGYPSGTVNRHVFSGTATAMGRGSWNSAVSQIINQSSYCNVALEGTIDVQSRVLTVDVEVYYTGNSSATSNKLNVALIQNNVEGPQTGASNFYPEMILPNGNYNHMHMLRHLITGQWGDNISTVTQGALIQRQYTYTLPADINGVPLEIGNLEIVAFVSEGNQEIITGNKGVLSFTNLSYTNNVKINNVTYKNEICSDQQFKASLKIENKGQDLTSFTIAYNMNNGTSYTHTFNENIASLTSKTVDIPNFNFNLQDTNTFNVQVTNVNGNADEDNADSTFSANDIVKTQNFGMDNSLKVTITQDRYGSETTWSIKDDSGAVVASGGPYQDLSSNGTLDHVHNITLPYGCYEIEVDDSYGDGMCCQFGNGGFKIETSNNNLVLQGSGSFSKKTASPFRTSPYSLNTEEETLNDISIYPNPNKGNITITTNEEFKFNITNILGKKVVGDKTIFNYINLDISHLSNGVYYINFTNDNNSISKKIILNK